MNYVEDPTSLRCDKVKRLWSLGGKPQNTWQAFRSVSLLFIVILALCFLAAVKVSPEPNDVSSDAWGRAEDVA